MNQPRVQLAAAGHQLHGFACCNRSHQGHSRPDDAGSVAGGGGAGRWRPPSGQRRQPVARRPPSIFGSPARNEGGRHAVGGDDAGIYPGDGQASGKRR